MSFVYVRDRSKRKKPSPKVVEANRAHKEYIAEILKGKTSEARSFVYDLSVAKPGVAPVSDSIPGGGGFRRSIDDYKWRRGSVETKETIQEIERKKTRIAPAFNKGAVQYISEGDDPKTLGRKI